MNRLPAAGLCAIAFLAPTAATMQVARSQDNTHTRETISMIQMDLPSTSAEPTAKQAGADHRRALWDASLSVGSSALTGGFLPIRLR